MTRLRLALLGAGASLLLAIPAQAQHQGHSMPMPVKKPAAKKPVVKKPAAKKPVMKKPAVKKPTVRKPTAKPAADPHSGHDMSAKPSQPAPAADPHAGHDMSTMPAATPPSATMPAATDPHAGHDMGTMPGAPVGTNLPAGDAPPPPVPTDHAADAIYGDDAQRHGRHHLYEFHGGQNFFQAMLNIFEHQITKGRDGFEWDGEAWYGGDINRLVVKSEGEGAWGRSLEQAEVQALYSRAIGPYFNVQGGIRYDIKPNPSRAYAAVGLEGMAPYFFEVEGTLFLSNKGEAMARLEGYYDQRITQRLILQPRAELNFAAQSSREIGVGAGLSDAEVGLRLRYDIRREFAPYVGVQYRQTFGDTRRYLREEGEDGGSVSLLIGVRTWF